MGQTEGAAKQMGKKGKAIALNMNASRFDYAGCEPAEARPVLVEPMEGKTGGMIPIEGNAAAPSAA
jgi:hypothetical protein